MHEILIKKLHSDVNIPKYETEGSSGLDLEAYIEKDLRLLSGERKLVPTGVSVAMPNNFEIQIRPRSGLAYKNGISVVNTPGTIDSDYRGEIKVLLINLGTEAVTIKKFQRIAQMVITPTTKGDVDIPITRDEIIKNGYMTADEYDYIASIAFKLFSFGQTTAEKFGFILVDTKYEFGKTSDNKIILIDELHTCDSSRYWIKDTYEYKFNKGDEPDKFDKDCIRDWVKTSCKDPYKDIIPELPTEIISWVYNNYNLFYKKLTYKS